MAINNYRQSGGGNFPAVKTAPVLSNSQQEIRQRIIDYVVARGTLDAAVFSQSNWRLTVNGAPPDRHRLTPSSTHHAGSTAAISATGGLDGPRVVLTRRVSAWLHRLGDVRDDGAQGAVSASASTKAL